MRVQASEQVGRGQGDHLGQGEVVQQDCYLARVQEGAQVDEKVLVGGQHLGNGHAALDVLTLKK